MSARFLLVLAVACGSPRRGPALPAAGSPGDDGTGQLARASARLLFGEDGTRSEHPPNAGEDPGAYGGGVYGGWTYGGLQGAFGYGARAVTPSYDVVPIVRGGAVEGVVRWSRPSAVTAELTVAGCGHAKPTLRRARDGAIEGAVVYLVDVQRGRPLGGASQSLSVGGLVEKRGCALWPPTQVLVPAPGAIVVSNAAAGVVRLVVRGADLALTPVVLDAGDRRIVTGQIGVTEIADAEGSLPSAWVLGLGHPYATLTDDQGRFRIDDIPPGTYQLAVWHPPLGQGRSTGVARSGEGAGIDARQTIKVTAAASTHVAVDLSRR